jgi:hypothetical protein
MIAGLRQSTKHPTLDTQPMSLPQKVHHVIFGVKLKEKMDAIGVEADLQYPDVTTKYGLRERFLITKSTAAP